MKDNQAKYPQLRFKGFTDPWEESKLGDTLTELKSGLSRMLSNNDIGLPVVRANNINDGQFNIDSDVKYWYVNDPQGANTVNYLIRKNDILINFINSEAKMGTATIVENTPIRDTIYTTNILRARLKKEYDSYYWFALTQINQYKINIKIITKPAVNQASFTTVDFKKLNFMFPNLKEQQKIGSFFKQLDDTIALHQRKLAKLKELKQGYLQKLFPRNGSKFPQLRFAGFADAWEQRKTKELCDISTGKGNTQDKVKDGKYPFYVRSATIERSNEYLYDQEAVLTVGDGVGTGKVFHYVNGKYNLHQRVYRMFNFNHGVSAKYFYHYFSKNFYRRVMSMTAKTSVDSVRMEMIADMKIKFPSPAEQETIVAVLDGVDDLISLHQRKLEKLQELKKGYLQKMFC
ncbi:restriction endonuclease subunit S [Lactiplantibacillus plantarum]|uniref:restriction endonuclease subunit S n=1 Tax=Lactiplantibacillus plantarum TaxID=1590 RepID=UPI003F52B7BA